MGKIVIIIVIHADDAYLARLETHPLSVQVVNKLPFNKNPWLLLANRL